MPDHGDPSQDVAVATILFLIDGKLVLLQPTTTEEGVLKYEMRIIAQNVEYYALMRDHPSFKIQDNEDYLPPSPSAGLPNNSLQGHDLRDSLWYFDGQDMKLWIDAQDVLVSASLELGRELPATVSIPVDFYPLSPLLNKGILFGVESDLVQRRDISFAYFRFATRVSAWWTGYMLCKLTGLDSPFPAATTSAPPGTIQLSCSVASVAPLPASALLPACLGDLAA